MKHFALPVIALLLLTACGQEPAKNVGKKVGETITDFASGVGQGVDTKLKADVELSPALTGAGLSTTVAKTGGLAEEKKEIIVYFVASKPFAGTLLAVGKDKDGQEIGRASADVDLAASDAKYVTFAFPAEMDSALLAKCEIDKKP